MVNETTPKRLSENPLGFGCAYITGGFEKHSNIRLLRIAYDNGIRHFDTAPMYGRGTSESVVGEAFYGMRNMVSLATKVGIPRPHFTLTAQLLRAAASPARRLLPSISRRAAANIYRGKGITKDFSSESVRRSVESSLRQLRTDHVDILLMHEIELTEVSDELLQTLELLKSEGKVLEIGLGTSRKCLEEIDQLWQARFKVYQRTWSLLRSDESMFQGKLNVFHRAVLDAMNEVTGRITADKAFAARIVREIDFDVANSDELAKTLIGASVDVNPEGLTLFGSRQSSRVATYARDAASPSYRERGRALMGIVRTQPPPR